MSPTLRPGCSRCDLRLSRQGPPNVREVPERTEGRDPPRPIYRSVWVPQNFEGSLKIFRIATGVPQNLRYTQGSTVYPPSLRPALQPAAVRGRLALRHRVPVLSGARSLGSQDLRLGSSTDNKRSWLRKNPRFFVVPLIFQLCHLWHKIDTTIVFLRSMVMKDAI